MSSPARPPLQRLGIIRLESHISDGTRLYAASSFPNFLRCLAGHVPSLALVLPIDRPARAPTPDTRTHYELRPADRLFPLGNSRGLLRAYCKVPLLLVQLARLRLFTSTVLVRAPEHLNFVMPLLLRVLRFETVIWWVHDRAEVERAMLQRQTHGLRVKAAVALSRRMGRMERNWARNHAVITNGSALQQQLTVAGVRPSQMLKIVSTTFSREDLQPQPPPWRRDPGQPLEILYVGRIALEKGLGDLIEAIRLLTVPAGPNVQLSLIGWTSQGEQERLLAQIQTAGLESRIRFMGPVPFGPTLFQHYRAAHLFVLPSWGEGTPRVLVEAMAMGRPIVATRVGGVPDLVVNGVNGMLVPPKQPTELARAIATFAADPELCRRTGRTNWQQAEAFTAETLAGRMAEFIATHGAA